MNFLVILICLTINYLWLKDFDRFDDGWFFRFRCRIESSTQSTVDNAPSGWVLNIVLIYLLPMIALVLLLVLVAEQAFGIPTMLVHILVLLVVFDRTQPGKLATDFVKKWSVGDAVTARLFLEQELNSAELETVTEESDIVRYFNKHLIYRCFEKMFVVFFWYMLTGPLGVAFCYISYQMQDSHRENQAPALVKMVAIMIWCLEWIPMRLLALTFSLAGNFVQCFENIKGSFWDFSTDSNNPELLYSYSRCALSGIVREMAEDSVSESDESVVVQREVAEILALQALLERSQAIWLALLAVITIFGLQY